MPISPVEPPLRVQRVSPPASPPTPSAKSLPHSQASGEDIEEQLSRLAYSTGRSPRSSQSRSRSYSELGEDEEGRPTNGGVHLSMYVDDLGAVYDRADALDLAFVNYRFKRRALTKDEALEQCMFRVLDVVDPLAPDAGPIVQIEHEIRSCVKPDGSKYKSCPLREV